LTGVRLPLVEPGTGSGAEPLAEPGAGPGTESEAEATTEPTTESAGGRARADRIGEAS